MGLEITQLLRLRKIDQMIIKILGKTPPKEIPEKLLMRYTLNGKINVEKWYFNEAGLVFMPRFCFGSMFNRFFEMARNREEGGYGKMDTWLYDAIEKYPIKNKSVVNLGSASPHYECIFLYYGGKKVTTIEYNPLLFFHSKLKTITPAKFEKNPAKFDVGFSLSSFEHDGLGRYGDPLNPDGDLQIMKKMKKVLKKGGILFLAVPVGKDLVVWNAHRIYGKLRLSLLLKGWEILDTFGFEESKLNVDNKKGTYQPVFVLKNV